MSPETGGILPQKWGDRKTTGLPIFRHSCKNAELGPGPAAATCDQQGACQTA